MNRENEYMASWDERVAIYRSFLPGPKKLRRILSLIGAMRDKGYDKRLYACTSHMSFYLRRQIGYHYLSEEPYVIFQFDDMTDKDQIGDGMIVKYSPSWDSHFLDCINLRYADITLTPDIEKLLDKLMKSD